MASLGVLHSDFDLPFPDEHFNRTALAQHSAGGKVCCAWACKSCKARLAASGQHTDTCCRNAGMDRDETIRPLPNIEPDMTGPHVEPVRAPIKQESTLSSGLPDVLAVQHCLLQRHEPCIAVPEVGRGATPFSIMLRFAGAEGKRAFRGGEAPPVRP